jgi:hypothetical protein
MRAALDWQITLAGEQAHAAAGNNDLNVERDHVIAQQSNIQAVKVL